MKQLLRFSASLLGAVMGFTAGYYGAHLAGYRTPAHLLWPGVTLGVLGSCAGLLVAARINARASAQRRDAIAIAVTVFALFYGCEIFNTLG